MNLVILFSPKNQNPSHCILVHIAIFAVKMYFIIVIGGIDENYWICFYKWSFPLKVQKLIPLEYMFPVILSWEYVWKDIKIILLTFNIFLSRYKRHFVPAGSCSNKTFLSSTISHRLHNAIRSSTFPWGKRKKIHKTLFSYH
jgi:hypothetical protein